MPKFFDKEKYVLHYENLQLYLRPGLKLKKTDCVLEFNPSKWLKPYIEFNTQKRIDVGKSGDNDGKTLFKLMKNAICGKSMENLKNRIDARLVNNEKHYFKWTS